MKPSAMLTALSLASASLFAGCGVGPYHIPNVAPVVMPEPEEDLFADIDFEDSSDDSSSSSEAAPEAAEKPAEEAKPADEAKPDEAAPAEAPAPAKPAKKK
jgi:hypothetical protein